MVLLRAWMLDVEGIEARSGPASRPANCDSNDEIRVASFAPSFVRLVERLKGAAHRDEPSRRA